MCCNCTSAVKLGFKKNDSRAKIPIYSTKGAAGMDVCAIEDNCIEAGEFKIISTGLIPVIPNGYELQVRPRSGLAAKKGITVLNTPGTIDEDYTGVIGVILINHSKECFEIHEGDRIAQLILSKVPHAEIFEATEVEETDRGAGGFGSTGVK